MGFNNRFIFGEIEAAEKAIYFKQLVNMRKPKANSLFISG
jgi:hypothetical protein